MSDQPAVSKKRKAGTVKRYITREAKKTIASGKKAISQLSQLGDLRAEVELLTSYSTDTIYRLRYDTMNYDYISPAVVRLLGYQPEEMQTMNIRALIQETRLVSDGMKAVESFEGLENARKGGDVGKWQADYLMRTKDGKKIWVSDISYPWFGKDGNIVGSVGSLRDITDRILAEEKAKAEMERMATTDMLTGLANRRAFFEGLEEELKRVKRHRRPLSLLLIDIDHFKKLNDEHGHDAGDKVIQGISDIIRSCLRETDVAARLGGEEYGVFLPDTPAEGACWVAERIRASVSKKNFSEQEGKLIGCTVSIGVSASGSHGSEEIPSSTTLYKTADTRLYIAKHTGRNQVSMDEIVNMH
ncbi:MAG: GGDEF domain-containing protein [Alphaproteobacteria bacterium]|nr:GGDEF domain-containing protein [Alphaproteobacteria bacterium]